MRAIGKTAALVVLAGILCAADPQAALRERMVREHIEARGVRHAAVLGAMRATPRHLFVPASVRDMAYEDRPLPIGYQATISQPYIVARMTELLAPAPGQRVLEIGTGSGYQAAVLAQLVKRVYSIELVPELAASARETLRRLGYPNVTVRQGDGYKGWPEEAPFDAIIVTAGAEHVPPALVAQLKPGARMVIPVGSAQGDQDLLLVEKDLKGAVHSQNLLPVRFVPLLRGKR